MQRPSLHIHMASQQRCTHRLCQMDDEIATYILLYVLIMLSTSCDCKLVARSSSSKGVGNSRNIAQLVETKIEVHINDAKNSPHPQK